jgi:mono/diheme cytochrome c family protein
MVHSASGNAAPAPRPKVSRTVLLGAWGLLLAGVLAAGALRSAASAAPGQGSAASKGGDVERGKYLVTITGCNDCHTPLKMGPQGPQPDTSRLLSGHPAQFPGVAPPALAPDAPWNWSGAATATAFAGPWGVSYATNLTPDANTGLGIWTQEMFVKAMRTGRHMGQSRPILPPMPWQNLAAMTDQDLAAVYAYLRSIPAIANRVPDSVVAEPPAPAGAP